jgi:hypothetical protein
MLALLVSWSGILKEMRRAAAADAVVALRCE